MSNIKLNEYEVLLFETGTCKNNRSVRACTKAPQILFRKLGDGFGPHTCTMEMLAFPPALRRGVGKERGRSDGCFSPLYGRKIYA